MIERNQGVVTMHDVSPLALRQLIDYAYSGEITITEDNVQVFVSIFVFFLMVRGKYCVCNCRSTYTFRLVFHCRFYCPPPVYCRYNRCARLAANFCFVSCTHPTVWAYEVLQVRISVEEPQSASARISFDLLIDDKMAQ